MQRPDASRTVHRITFLNFSLNKTPAEGSNLFEVPNLGSPTKPNPLSTDDNHTSRSLHHCRPLHGPYHAHRAPSPSQLRRMRHQERVTLPHAGSKSGQVIFQTACRIEVVRPGSIASARECRRFIWRPSEQLISTDDSRAEAQSRRYFVTNGNVYLETTPLEGVLITLS